MKVVVPYTNLLPAVELALAADWITPDKYFMENDFSYFDLLSRLWGEEETFVIVEHDVVPWPGAIAEILSCSESWCAFPYRLSFSPGYTPALGCTKFSAEIQKQTPGAWERLAEGLDFSCQEDPRHWLGLDGRIGLVLGSMIGKAWPHRHEPPVTHLNAKQCGLNLHV